MVVLNVVSVLISSDYYGRDKVPPASVAALKYRVPKPDFSKSTAWFFHGLKPSYCKLRFPDMEVNVN